MDSMNPEIRTLKEESGRIKVSFPYNPIFVEKIQELLGHKRAETTQIYTHVMRKDLGAIPGTKY